jgi:chemotaxis protein MotB
MSTETDGIPKPKDRGHSQQEGGMDSWLMSYADMITLLLCFFIIFVSVSEPKQDKFSQITEGLVNRFGTVDLTTPLKGVFEAVQQVVEKHQALRDVSVEKTQSGIAMEISSRKIFEPGSAEITEANLSLLTDLVASLKTADFLEYRIIIEGHTSDEQLPSAFLPTNWDLSAARAARVVRYFIEQGIKTDRIRAVAYADSKPKVPNRGVGDEPILENREQNQRMVIKLERVL